MGSSSLCQSVLLLSFASLLLQTRVRAAEYSVGDDERWETGVNFLSWSEKYKFTVGDFLVFRYSKGQHDVYEVTEETFRSCNSSTGLLQRYATGNDRVALTDAGKYWFICNVEGHCLGGMKFGITVSPSRTTRGIADVPFPGPAPPHNGVGAGRGGSANWLLWSGWVSVVL